MKVFSWGANSHGQLSQGHTEDLVLPTELLSCPVSASEIASISGGGGHSLLVTKNGHIYSSGSNDRGESCGETKVKLNFTEIFFSSHRIVQATCGWDFSLALTDNGQVFTWGSNSFGQLGVSYIAKSSCPVEVFIGETDSNLDQQIPSPVTQVAAGIRHCVILTENNEVYTWGAGRKGQLGFLDSDKCLSKSEKPVKLTGLKNSVQVIAGSFHSGVLTDTGGIYIWGCNKYGQSTQLKSKMLPLPTKIPANNFPLLTDDFIKELHSGWSHLLVLTKNCQLISWGRCDYGQLGRPVLQTVNGGNYDPIPQTIMALDKCVCKVFCGAEHNIVIVAGGKLLCWGWNEHGMCGNGDEINQPTPVPCLIADEFHTLTAGCGSGHSFAIVNV